MTTKKRVKWVLAIGLLALGACKKPDWKPQAIAAAEAKVRDEVVDPSAVFSGVQLTGDERTGQTCGYVTAKSQTDAQENLVRFIVYIDGTSGPYVEAGMGKVAISQADFDRAWQADCVNEGYTS